MTSGLKLSESSAHLYTNNKYTQMSAGLKLSESSAHLYVDSKYTQMQSGLAVTMDSATLYAKNRTTRAYIVARINADGEGEAIIEADKVSITGATTISGSMEINGDGYLVIKKYTMIQGNVSLVTANTMLSAPILQCSTNGYLRIYGSSADTKYDLTASALGSMVKTISVSNNTLTLTRWDGTSVNFSKATWQTGSWSSGALTVKAKQQNGSSETDVSTLTRNLTTGTKSWSGNTCTVPIRAYYGNTPPTYEDTGFNVTVDASARYNAGFDAVSGDDITLQGDGTSPKSSKPSIAAVWSETSTGKKKVTAYIWAKHTNGSWYKLRSFSFTEP